MTPVKMSNLCLIINMLIISKVDTQLDLFTIWI